MEKALFLCYDFTERTHRRTPRSYMIRNILIVIFNLLTFIGSFAAIALEPIEDRADIMNIQSLLQEYAQDNGTPGAALGFIDCGKIHFFSCGNMTGNGDPISENTIFEIGSVTKVFTTLALMDMVAKGDVRLDDPIELYLPGVKVPEKDGKKITLRHLAVHNSGLPRLPDNLNYSNTPENPYKDYTIENLYEFLSQHSLQRAPGEQFEYSNLGMGLLGHVLCLRSGKNYEELISNVLTQKLGMNQTLIEMKSDTQEKFAIGHQCGKAVPYWNFQQSTAGAGALRSNIKDMALFLAANMGLTQSPITNLLQQCHQQYDQNPTFSVGLGWILSKSNDTELIWHNGGTGGFRSYLGFNPKNQRGVVILSNSAEEWPDELGHLLLDPNYKRPVIDKTLSNNSDYLNKFSGPYEATISTDQPQQQVDITVYGKLLGIVFSGGEIGMLYPESEGVFGVKGFPDGRVYFSFDEKGNVAKAEARLLSSGTVLWEALPKSKG